MIQHLYILSGASRGMGLAMAQQLLSPNNFVLGLSRHPNERLNLLAVQLGCPLEQCSLDLEKSVEAAEFLAQWLGQHLAATFASATLINNAGVMPRITPVSESDPTDLARALRVGLEAPMLLTAAFLKSTQAWNIPLKVLNISSGLGRRAMASQAGYCAAKAGLDHFTCCLALDEALKPHGARVCSLAPGVIDTDMQEQLREADESHFPDQNSFINLKKKGQLTPPTEAATRVLAYLARPDFGNDPIGDVRS